MKKQNTLLAPLLIGIFIGAMPAYYFGKSSHKTSFDYQTCESLKSQEQQVVELANSDYRRYLTMPESKFKCEKAEELLNKVIVLFLADLAHHIVGDFEQPESFDATVSTTAADITLKGESAERHGIQGNMLTEPKAPLVPSTRATADEILWAKVNKTIKESISEKEAIEALNKAIIPDLSAVLKTSTGIKKNNLDILNGKYVGAVTFFDGREPWHIEWNIEGSMVGNAASGNYEITMSKQGKTFSRSSGNISARTFKVASADPNVIIMDTYNGYLQLYVADKLDKIIGNMYLKLSHEDDISMAKRQATVVLERVR